MDAARVGARVNVEGVRQVVSEMSTWLRVLRDIRKELDGINSAASKFPSSMGAAGGAAGAPTGAAPGVPNPSNLSSFSRMQSMQRGFAGAGGGAAGSVGAYYGGRVAATALNYGTGRFNRNLAESTPISQNDILLTSMYSGFAYGKVDRQRLSSLGRFGMSRSEAASAQGIGLGYGQSASQTNTFLSRTVAPLVQASGGTLTPSAAAGQAAAFLDPLSLRTAQSFGITPGRVNGQVGNPLTVAQGYIKDFEKRFNVRLNTIDYENMRSPGSPQRYNLKRMYQLSDESVDVIIQSGLQNAKFTSKFGHSIDFSSSKDLSAIGASTNRLGLKAFQYMSASASREARFFQKQEGAQVGKLQQDINIENTLANVEDAFSGLIGPMGEFQKYLKGAVGALQMVLGMNAVRSVLGGGGGGGILGGGGLLGGGGGGGLLGGGGGAGGMGMGAGIAGAAALGAAGYMAAGYGAKKGGWGGAAVGIGGTALAWGAAGGMLGGPAGAAVGAVAGAGYGAYKYFGARTERQHADARDNYASSTEEALIRSGIPGLGQGGGTKAESRLDTMQMRRGALIAAMLNDLGSSTDAFSGLSTKDAKNVAGLGKFFSSKSVTKDMEFVGAMAAYGKLVAPAISRGGKDASDIYSRYFQGVSSPFDFSHANTTDEAKGLVVNQSDMNKAIITGDNVGDPISGKGANGATWDKLDPQLKSPLSAMLKAAGGRVWLGNGWRSEEQQKNLFFDRHHEDPNGDIAYNGKRYTLNKGASPAAPPGRSYHEIGLAADLEGDLDWVQQNAAKFGLKTFGGVNNEPWHVQPAGIPNARADYVSGGISAAESYANGGVLGDSGTGASYGGGGGGPAADSGVGFSLASARPSSASGGGWGGTAAASTSGALGGSTAAPGGAGGQFSSTDVARFAYNAGFRGSDLVNFVSIAMRESNGLSTASNEKGVDMSYGLFQINLKPWLDKGQTPPYTKEQLFDPQFNANVAFQYFKQAGMSPWTIKGDWSAKTDHAGAAAAVGQAGLGDGAFDKGGGGGGYHYNPVVHLSVQLNATGNLGYDASMLAAVAKSQLDEHMALSARRTS